MGEIDNNKGRVADLSPHNIVNYPRTSNIAHIDYIETDADLHGGLYNGLNKGVEYWVIEFHGNESVPPGNLATLLGFIMFPAV